MTLPFIFLIMTGSGIWPAARVFPEASNPMQGPRAIENTSSQQHPLGIGILDARTWSPPSSGTWISIIYSILALIRLQPLNLFVKSADELYGPITTIRTKGEPKKHIKWAAFEFPNEGWQRIKDARDILQVSYLSRPNCIY
jgi:hypothetical protein